MAFTDIFEDLFVLEMTNNHRGSLERGIQITDIYSKIVHSNNVRAAMKLQFRDLGSFIHKDFVGRNDIRYIKRITETRMSKENYAILVKAIREKGLIPMATPFDEESVNWCSEFELPIIKVASVSSNDWFLLEKIAATGKPIIVSTGGTSIEDIDDLVSYFGSRSIPLALNHCVAAYPTEDNEMELSQIDFLRARYPHHVIGLSSHEFTDWTSSVQIAYAKGARLFERHIDIKTNGEEISAYSSLPEQIDIWFKAYRKAREMCGVENLRRKEPIAKEAEYLDLHRRGIYANADLLKGQQLTKADFYWAIPLQHGQISTLDLQLLRFNYRMTENCSKDSPITADMVEAYALSE